LQFLLAQHTLGAVQILGVTWCINLINKFGAEMCVMWLCPLWALDSVPYQSLLQNIPRFDLYAFKH